MRNLNVHQLNVIGLNKISLGPGLLSAPKPATPQYVKNGLIFMLDCKSLTNLSGRWTSESGLKCEPFSFDYRDVDGNKINFVKSGEGVSIDYPNDSNYKGVFCYNDEYPNANWNNGCVFEYCVKLKSISNLALTKYIYFGIQGNTMVGLTTHKGNSVSLQVGDTYKTREGLTLNDTDIYTIAISSCGNVWINGQAVGDKFAPYAKKDVASVPHGKDGSLYFEGNAVIYSARIYGNDVVFGDAQALNNYNADQARYGVKEFTLDESVLDGNDWLG